MATSTAVCDALGITWASCQQRYIRHSRNSFINAEWRNVGITFEGHRRSAARFDRSYDFLLVFYSNYTVFQKSSVATYCRRNKNLCDAYIENFLTNHLVKEFWKSAHICQSYYQTSNSLLFWNTVYMSLFCTVPKYKFILSENRKIAKSWRFSDSLYLTRPARMTCQHFASLFSLTGGKKCTIHDCDKPTDGQNSHHIYMYLAS